MGRDKFGYSFGVTAARELPGGSWEFLDLRNAGVAPDEHRYETTSEARMVFTRIAEVVRSRMVPWLDEDPLAEAASAAPPNAR
jgi:hypothetical protein